MTQGNGRATIQLEAGHGTILIEEAGSVTRPSDYQSLAIADLGMVNVFGNSFSTRKPSSKQKYAVRQCRLSLTAWVNNFAFEKDVWVDLCIVDPSGRLVVPQERFALEWLGPADGNGDFFILDKSIRFPASLLATPSDPTEFAVPWATDPCAGPKLQYRLYYRASGRVFTDGQLHEHELPERPSVP
jgi:hypothetical protein